MEGVAPSAPQKKLVIIDRSYGEMQVLVSDPECTMVIIVDENVAAGEGEDEYDCSVEEPLGIDKLCDDVRPKVIEILKAEMSPEPQDVTP